MFFENDEWHSWFVIGDELRKIKAEPAESTYFSKHPVANSDIFSPFLNFIGQRGNSPSILRYYSGLNDDIYNLAASLEKLDFYYLNRNSIKHGISRFVVTELEYIFLLCRSIFDLLQEMINEIWINIKFTDGRKTKKLKKSFTKVALFNERIHSEGEYIAKYNFTPELDSFYAKYCIFFKSLKDLRNGIAHGGSSFDVIFNTERGFAVQKNQKPFSDFNVWNENHMQKNNLCSLRPFVAFTVFKTLEACNDFVAAIQKNIQFPETITKEYNLYTRCSFGYQVNRLEEIIEKCLWYDEETKV